MEALQNIIIEKRPTLSEGSIKTYVNCLKSLHTKLFGKGTPIELTNFSNTELIMAHFEPLEFNKRKTSLSALVVITELPCYRELLHGDILKMKNKDLLQNKDGVFAENLITPEEVLLVVIKQKKLAALLYKKVDKTNTDITDLQNYILLCLTTGIYIPPRRSADWVIKFRNYDSENENYIDLKKKQFVLNAYKTVKTYGACSIDIPKELLAIIKKYLKIVPEGQDWLLFSPHTGKALAQSDIAYRLNTVFGKNISTSMLRHIYLTGKYPFINLMNMTEDAKAMGTDILQLMAYVKIGDAVADCLVDVDAKINL